MSPLLPLSAQLRYTIELLCGSTAIESVEPIRSCPSVGALDHGIETFFTTTTSLVAVLPSNLRQPKNAAYTVPSFATAGRTDGPSCPAVLRLSIGTDLYVAPPSTDTSMVAVRPLV